MDRDQPVEYRYGVDALKGNFVGLRVTSMSSAAVHGCAWLCSYRYKICLRDIEFNIFEWLQQVGPACCEPRNCA